MVRLRSRALGVLASPVALEVGGQQLLVVLPAAELHWGLANSVQSSQQHCAGCHQRLVGVMMVRAEATLVGASLVDATLAGAQVVVRPVSPGGLDELGWLPLQRLDSRLLICPQR